MGVAIRLATPADIPSLQDLIPASARELSRVYYSDAQIEAAIRYVFGVDSQLIADQTYYVAVDDETIVGAVGGAGGGHFTAAIRGRWVEELFSILRAMLRGFARSLLRAPMRGKELGGQS